MEAAGSSPSSLPIAKHPDVERIRRELLRKGVYPAKRFIIAIRKKEIRRSRLKHKLLDNSNTECRLSKAQEREIARESHFQEVSREYKEFCRALYSRPPRNRPSFMVGKPWESVEVANLKELSSASSEYCGDKLQIGPLRDLSDIIERKMDELRWLLDDDINVEGWSESLSQGPAREKKPRSAREKIQFLVSRLSSIDVDEKDWKFVRLMKLSKIQFTEYYMMKLLGGLSVRRQWRPAISAVKWVYSSKKYVHCRSRDVFTKLLTLLKKARRPHEAHQIFYTMLGDSQIYPDMVAYHSIAVTLGQAGLLRELLNIVRIMGQDRSVRTKCFSQIRWKEVIKPDLVVYNAILNACVPSRQWRGVAWVFQNLRKSGIQPNVATYGLAMEVMLQSGNYDLVSKFFLKMQRTGETLTAINYRALVRALWRQGKVDNAVLAVRDMEARGVVGIGSVYFHLACCLCNHGRWRDAMFEIENLKKLPHDKDLAITFTGMIQSAADGGHVLDSISIFEKMKYHCDLNIGVINAMLRIYGKFDMFSEAKKLFENVKGSRKLVPELHTHSAMLEASANAQQWEYFEYVYREMTLAGLKLNKIRHGFLLVEASSAGKPHLLEHAFELILECGGLPPFEFFVELICQATTRGRCERAASLASALAYASYEVDADYWVDLFRKNKQRFGMNNLKKLKNALCGKDVDEPTFKNLVSSLQHICGSDAPAAVDDNTIDNGSDDQNDEIFDLLSSQFDGENDDGGGDDREMMQSSHGGVERPVEELGSDDDVLPQADEILASWSGEVQDG